MKQVIKPETKPKKTNIMEVKDLIKILKKYPQDLPIRTLDKYEPDIEGNKWVIETEVHETGRSGYELCGEVILLTSE